MKALRAIRAEKTVVDGGKWTHGKRMPVAAFPLLKTSRGYRVGTQWDWCVYALETGADRYRLLIAFEQGKEQYQAWLGVEDGEDQALLARLEFHPTHRGWHCHVKPGDLGDVSRGVVKDRDEHVALCPSENVFGVTRLNAVGIAFRIFNVVEVLGPHQ